MKNYRILLSLFALAGVVFRPSISHAQNITDLAVANDKSADKTVEQGTGMAIPDSVFLHPDRIKYDSRCFQIDGKDQFVYSGTFHYFRTPQPLWRDRMQKMKDAGFNCVETYVPWNWHEKEMPASPDDYSKIDLSELEAFLQLADEFGLNVILRPGPYICAEWSGGGFPQWLMQKRPDNPTCKTWLQSNDPDFMRWNEHWYKAVCDVARPYQLTSRPVGATGIILFQIENDFNRVNWISKADKRDYLERLALIARDNGIEVPLITCWTREARNAKEGPLNGVLDMVNSYPRWQIDKNFGRLINQQLSSQPGKPLLSGELQGGWYSDVNGKLSWEQEGVAPVQTQNIVLYALQRGFCGINHYMVVGGTNFDDMNGRDVTATYDYAAAIGEDGSINERWLRYQTLADFLKRHGTRIARADLTAVEYECDDSVVSLALRQAANGDRYYFVRTEDYSAPHKGQIRTGGLTINYDLEPFGSMVYYYPAASRQGQWWPKKIDLNELPQYETAEIELAQTAAFDAPLSEKWQKLALGEQIDEQGIYGRHFAYYRAKAPRGKEIAVERIAAKTVNGSSGDAVVAMADGKLLPMEREDSACAYFMMPQGKGMGQVTVLYESDGLHHHTNKAVEDNWGIGPRHVLCEGKPLQLEYAYIEDGQGKDLSSGLNLRQSGKDNPLLKWHAYAFKAPADSEAVHLILHHAGNGFVYVNGHCIGRCYERGPQKDYWIPECWLNPEGDNHIAISLRPTENGNEITDIKLENRKVK